MSENTLTITWGDLEVGMRITGGWKVADLTATHITVASEEDGEMSTFTRKDPWEDVQIEAMPIKEIVQAWGGHVIREDVVGHDPVFFAWPDDGDFINAAQSHLHREHGIDPGERDYEALRQLHCQLHKEQECDHTHIERKD